MEAKRIANYISILLILIPFPLIFTINIKQLNEAGMIFYLLYWILPLTVGYIMYLCTADYKKNYSRKLFVWSNLLLVIITGLALLAAILWFLAIIFGGMILVCIVASRILLIVLIFAEHKKIIFSLKGLLILIIMVSIPIVSNQIYLKTTPEARYEEDELLDYNYELKNSEMILNCETKKI